MAQHDYVIANGTGAAVRSDLNNALAAIASQNSGATEPATMYAYQWWADTSTGLLKIRNGANNAWITLRELDGTLTIEDGTASSPGLAFADDLNTGIYSPSADQVAFTAGGTARLTATTTAITSALPVDVPLGSDSAPTVTFTGDLNTGIYSPGADQVAVTTNGVERVEWGTSEVVFNDGGANYDFRVEGDTEANLIFVDASADTVSFRDDVYIDGSGRLLVGTSSARSNFFNGSDTALVQVEGANNNAQRYSGHIYGVAGTGGPWHIFAKHRSNSIGGTTVVVSDDQIGALSFQGSDGTEFVESARIEAYVDGTPGANDMPGRLVFSTTADGSSSPTERMRIPQNGFTRFSNTGTYTDIATLAHGFRSDQSDWITEFVAANASPYGIHMQYTGAAPNNTGNEFIQCSDTGAVRATIRSNGGLANFSANNANLSDRNAKKDISPAADTWDCIKEWEIVNYRYKDQPDDADLNLGVIAQQVAESCPEVITVFEEAKDDQPEKLGVKEQQMYWMAIKALQEAQVRIEALEAEVIALKAQ